MTVVFALALLWLVGLGYAWRRGGGLLQTWFSLGGLGLAWVGFFWRPIFTPGVLMPQGGGDYVAFYFPNAVFAARELAGGRLPLWNPQIFGGLPFAADPQHGLFYPINTFFYLLNPVLSLRRYMLLTMGHYLLASVAAYALMRVIAVGHLGSMLTGVGYAYNGFMVAHFGHPPMIAVAAWLPIALLFAIRAGRARSWPRGIRASVLAGLALGIAALAGHAQIWIYGTLVFTAFAWLGVSATHSPWWRRAALWLLALSVAGGLSAVQTIPFLELAARSVRAELSYERSLELALHPVGLIQLLLPKLFGASPTTFWGPWAGSESQGYAGVVTLVLAGAALLRRGRLPWILLGLGGLGVLLALGGETPLHGWAYRLVPGLQQARAAGRALYIYVTTIAFLAGLGLDQLVRLWNTQQPLLQRGLTSHLRLTSLATFVLWFVILPVAYLLLLSNVDRPVLERLAAAVSGITLLAVLLLGASLLLWAGSSRRLGSLVAPVGLAALVVVDLFSAGFAYNPTTESLEASFQHQWALSHMVETADAFRLDAADNTADRWQPNLSLLSGPPDAGGGWNPLLLADAYRLWTAIVTRDSAYYNLFAARYLIIPHEAPPDPAKFSLLESNAVGLDLYRNEHALPRAFVVPQARVLPRDEVWQALQAPDWDPASEVLLEEGAGSAVQPGSAGQATIVATTPSQLVVQASTPASAYLVVSDSFYPGWHATVDGVPARLLRADYALRAVALPAGTHTIVFQFRPRSFYAGAAITLATAIGMGVGIWMSKRAEHASQRKVVKA